MSGAGTWAEAWVGREAPDCAALARMVLAEEFGRDVPLPSAPAPARPQTPGRAGVAALRRNDAAIRAALAGDGDIARPLGRGEAPCDGDGVLMRAAYRRYGIGHHIGIYVAGTDPACLHWRRGLGGALHRLRDLPARGLEVMGVYRWTV